MAFTVYPTRAKPRRIMQSVLNYLFQDSEAKVGEICEAGARINIPKDEIASYAYASELWILFSSFGVLCIIGLALYAKFIGARQASDLS